MDNDSEKPRVLQGSGTISFVRDCSMLNKIASMKLFNSKLNLILKKDRMMYLINSEINEKSYIITLMCITILYLS